MRSAKMKRSKVVEDAFEGELVALWRGLPYRLDGDHASVRRELYSVAGQYIDELNKVRKYACPLSTNMLLSSILESILLAMILEHSVEAAKSKTWIRAFEETFTFSRRRSPHPNLPMFTFAELIQIADELKLLRTSGVQQKVDLFLLEGLPVSRRKYISLSSWDAKRNHEIMHNLRGIRNAVHPMEIITKDLKHDREDFETTIWMGLRLLLLLNVMLNIKSPLNK